MKQFAPVPPQIRDAMASRHRLVQGAIAMIAHSNMGIPVEDEPRGAERYEGGVYVNGRQIVIKDSGVFGDGDAGQEENAVVDAIAMLVQAWIKEGPGILARFRSVRCGNPLRRFLALQEVAETV